MIPQALINRAHLEWLTDERISLDTAAELMELGGIVGEIEARFEREQERLAV